MSICHITIINKGIEYRYSLVVVLGNGATSLGMPGCEWLNILAVNCQKTDDSHIKRQINEQTKQDELKQKNKKT